MGSPQRSDSPEADWAGLRLRLLKGISWNVVWAMAGQGSTLVANVLVANFLGRYTFGEFGMTQNTLQVISGISQLAIGYTATKYVAEFRSTDKAKAGRIVGLCLRFSLLTAAVGALVLLLGASVIASRALKAPDLAPSLRIAACAVLFMGMNSCHVGILAGFEAFRTLGIASVLNAVIGLSACASLTWGFGLRGAVAALAVGALVQWAVYGVLVRSEARRQDIPILRGEWEPERKLLFKFALPAAMHGFTTLPVLWLMNTILARQANGFGQLALYTAASNLRVLAVFVPNIMAQVGLSILNNQKGLGNEVRYRKVFWTNLTLVGGIALLGAAGVLVLGPALLRAFGRDFQEAYPVLLILALSVLPEAIAVSAHSILQSHERMWWSFGVLNVPRDALLVVLTLLWATRWGALGLACAHTAGTVATLVLTVLLIWKQDLMPFGAPLRQRAKG